MKQNQLQSRFASYIEKWLDLTASGISSSYHTSVFSRTADRFSLFQSKAPNVLCCHESDKLVTCDSPDPLKRPTQPNSQSRPSLQFFASNYINNLLKTKNWVELGAGGQPLVWMQGANWCKRHMHGCTGCTCKIRYTVQRLTDHFQFRTSGRTLLPAQEKFKRYTIKNIKRCQVSSILYLRHPKLSWTMLINLQ